MSRIASQKTVRIDLGNEEWIDIRASISFQEIQEIVSDDKSTVSQITQALKLAEIAVKGWCLKDDDNNEVPFSSEMLKQLDINTMTLLQEKIAIQYGISKKN